MATYLTLVNELLRRLNEVTLDTGGDGFDTVRNVQALAKDAVNSSIRLILQDGQEWPFLKTTYTQTLSVGTRQYSFPADYSSADWDTFYLKKLTAENNSPMNLSVISYEQYIQNVRAGDDTGDQVNGDGPPTLVYQTLGSSFGVSPIPNTNEYAISYNYYTTHTDLSAHGDTMSLPDRFSPLVVDRCKYYTYMLRSDPQHAQLADRDFQRKLRLLKTDYATKADYMRTDVIAESITTNIGAVR